MTQLTLNLPDGSYKITIGKNILKEANEYMKLDRKVFILTDSGIPSEYSEAIKSQCADAMIYTVDSGEDSKSLSVMEEVLTQMMRFGLTRTDCAIAVGGGVVGDLCGFCAASYMRGIDFYNVPTTLLSQVDSSIGGKTAVNLGSVKNIVGAFYQPRAVLIDTEVLKTLSKRHFAAGLAESVKMALTSDGKLFEFFENNEITEDNLEDVIARSLEIKRRVVEEDEKECGLRKILNFGHTLGHGIEAAEGLSGLYHGECVSLGMLPVCSPLVRARLERVLDKLGLPTRWHGDIDAALDFISHDKKCSGDEVSVITVTEIGKFNIEKMSISEFKKLIKERF